MSTGTYAGNSNMDIQGRAVAIEMPPIGIKQVIKLCSQVEEVSLLRQL
jgi:hypothetical protein